MIRVVIDTNVLVSSLIAPRGNEASILLAAAQGLFVPCFSNEMLAEYAGVLTRRKFSFPPDEVHALLAMMRYRGELVWPSGEPFVSPDAGDTKFLACAYTSFADFLVTGNKRHFPEAQYGTTRVVNASDLLLRITSGL